MVLRHMRDNDKIPVAAFYQNSLSFVVVVVIVVIDVVVIIFRSSRRN